MSEHKNYDSPQAVLDDSNLSKDEKIHILREWADHEKQKLAAAEENMPEGDTADAGEKFKELVSALHTLGEDFGDTH